jgi:Derlin-2/3
MPPQVAGMNDLEGPGAWYKSLPIITKHWLTSSLLMTILCNLSILPTSSMIYNFTSIRNNFEIWRIFTPFLFMGNFSFQTALSFLFMYSFSRQYELGGGFNTGGGGGTADYLFMILFGAIFILISGSYVYGGVIFSMNLVYYVLYVWSKRHPYAQASIWGFPVQARYHPFALLGLTILMGNPWIPTAHGE